MSPLASSLDRFFRLTEHGTSVRTELLAGLTTFLTMAYIIFVQPAVLATDFAGRPTGLDAHAVLLATCLASAVATLAMGLWARLPIALAPGMGENFFFVSVVMSLGALGFPQPWRVALAIVFLSGVLFLLLGALRVREALLDSLSPSLSHGIAAGIGLFIAFIGLRNAGLIVGRPGTLVGLAPHPSAAALGVFALGLVVTAALQARRVRGAILGGLLAAAALAAALGQVHFTGVFGWPTIRVSAVAQLDLRAALSLACLPFILVFLFMVLFDTVGTLVGVSRQAGLMRGDRLPQATPALLADAFGTTVGALLGTSTVTSYIESAAGVEQGGRTGLTALTVAALFLVALGCAPLVALVGSYPPITAPALLVVGALMLRNAAHIAWEDFSEALPAFLMLVGIPLSYSIADGLALGFVSYPAIKLLSGRGREVRWPLYVVAVVVVMYFGLVRGRLG